MSGFPYGEQVVAGTDATSGDFNNGRKDALTRWLKFEVQGGLVAGNKQGGSYVMPFAGTVVQTYSKMTSGSCTFRINAGASGTSTIDSSENASSTEAVDSSISSPSFAKGDLMTMDIQTVTSGIDLVVLVEVLAIP